MFSLKKMFTKGGEHGATAIVVLLGVGMMLDTPEGHSLITTLAPGAAGGVVMACLKMGVNYLKNKDN